MRRFYTRLLALFRAKPKSRPCRCPGLLWPLMVGGDLDCDCDFDGFESGV